MIFDRTTTCVARPAFLFFALSSCAPTVGPDQFAVRFWPSYSRPPALQPTDEAACARASGGYVKLHVECMQRMGYRAEILGQGGVRVSVAQLPEPPANMRENREAATLPMRGPATMMPQASGQALSASVGTRWYCPNGDQVVLYPERRAVEMISPPCSMLLVDGQVGNPGRGRCNFLIGAFNLRQRVTYGDHSVRWSFQDAGSGLLTALNRGTGGGSASLDTRSGVMVSSLGDRVRCHK